MRDDRPSTIIAVSSDTDVPIVIPLAFILTQTVGRRSQNYDKISVGISAILA